jgi:hypothetical protein
MIPSCLHAIFALKGLMLRKWLENFSLGANMQIINHGTHRWFGLISVVTSYFNRLIFIVSQAFQDSRFVLHAVGKLRRLGLVHLKKEYVQRQLLVRTGACRQCGTCCNLLYTCPMLTKQGRCLVYGFCRPQACKVFPIDQRDIDEVNLCGGHCGYRFDRKDAPATYKTGRS